MTTDPIVRLTAGAILVLATTGGLAVVVHGYWVDPAYVIPAPVSWIVGSAISGALTLLGVHIGAQGAQAGVTQGAVVSKEAIVANGQKQG